MSQPDPRLVMLRTGKQVPENVVMTCSIALELLAGRNPNAVAELLYFCENPSSPPTPASRAALVACDMIQYDASGRVKIHDDVRNAVQALAELVPPAKIRFMNPFPPA